MMQMDRFAVTAAGVQLLGDLPAFGPLPNVVRAASGGGDLVRLGAAGLSIASGLAAWLEYALLRRAVKRVMGPTNLAGGQLQPVLIAASIAALAAGGVRPLVSDLHPLVGGTVAVGAMAAVYFAAARSLGVTEIRNALAGLHRRLFRK